MAVLGVGPVVAVPFLPWPPDFELLWKLETNGGSRSWCLQLAAAWPPPLRLEEKFQSCFSSYWRLAGPGAGLRLTPHFLSLLLKCLWGYSPLPKRERAIGKSSHFPFSPLSLLVDYGRTQQCPG